MFNKVDIPRRVSEMDVVAIAQLLTSQVTCQAKALTLVLREFRETRQ